MKKDHALIVAAVIIAILLVSNLMSLNKIGKLNGQMAQLDKVIQEKDFLAKSLNDQLQVKQMEADELRKALDSLEIRVTAIKPAPAAKR